MFPDNCDTQYPRKQFVERNELDRYGFSWVLAERSGLKVPPKSFASWAHGWSWGRDVGVDIIFTDHFVASTPKDLPIVVAISQHRELLVDAGFKNVRVGGLPFAYVSESVQKRKKDSLLFILQHSARDLVQQEIAFVEYMGGLVSDFSEVYCCLYDQESEVKNPALIKMCRQLGIGIVRGARGDDMNSLYRLRAIYDHFDFVVTNSLGSHVVYASYCSCRVSVLERFYMDWNVGTELYESPRLATLTDINNVKRWYPHFFVDHPSSANNAKEWAAGEIGAASLLSNEEIHDVLGWSFLSKIKAVMRGGRRRLLRTVSKVT